MSNPKVFLFWDNSNIFISAKNVAQTREGVTAKQCVRIHFTNLFKLAAGGRPVAKAVVVGSIPPEQREVWDRLKQDTGMEPELYERGSESGTEQGLDQCLQTHMLRAYADHINDPQIVVLLTGDGAGYDVGSGFHADLERMQKNGWGIELIAWDISCRRTLKTWASTVGQYIRLEDYYAAVTFLEGIRAVAPLNLSSRLKAKVSESQIDAVKRQAEEELAQVRKELEDRKSKDKERERKKAEYSARQKKRAGRHQKKGRRR